MKATLLSLMAGLLIGSAAVAQQDSTGGMNGTMGNTGANSTTGTNGKIGKMSVASFNSINAKGNQMVSAITPTKTALSAADQKLMMQVAAGGQRQLAISQALLDKVTNSQVKLLAASEVEEQTGVSAKLKEIADAKGVTLPDGPDSSVQTLVAQIQNLSGADLDAFYINESGIKGHELLQKTMLTVSGAAKDATLKKLAIVTLPVIRTHLTVSREVKSMMGTTGTGAAK